MQMRPKTRNFVNIDKIWNNSVFGGNMFKTIDTIPSVMLDLINSIQPEDYELIKYEKIKFNEDEFMDFCIIRPKSWKIREVENERL